jgi:hypothetical protein
MNLHDIKTREELREYVSDNGQYKILFAKQIADEGEFQCLLVRRLSDELAHVAHKTRNYSNPRHHRELAPLVPFLERALERLKTAVRVLAEVEQEEKRKRALQLIPAAE